MFDGKRLLKMRTERGWSQERLGEVIGVSRSAINKYEVGVVTDVKASQVELLASALGCSAAYLVCWTDDPLDFGGGSCVASNISDSAVVQGNNATTLIVRNGGTIERELNDRETDLLRILEMLDEKGRTALMSYAYKLEEKKLKEGSV